jgi:hypothetical protein
MTTQETARSASAPGLSFLMDVRRVGGIAGILYVVCFVAGIFLQGDTPMFDDDASAIREFFSDGDKTNMYLIADWLIGLAFVLFFLPFASALRSVLGPADATGGMWARLTLIGALLALAAGLASSMGWGAMAVINAEGLDDSTLLFANALNVYGFGSGVPVALAAFMLPASIVIVSSGVLWRWLGWAGLVISLLNVAGALWVVQGDQESLIGLLGLLGFAGYGLWTLAASIGLLMRPKAAV